jgi:hypothetical protein
MRVYKLSNIFLKKFILILFKIFEFFATFPQLIFFSDPPGPEQHPALRHATPKKSPTATRKITGTDGPRVLGDFHPGKCPIWKVRE